MSLPQISALNEQLLAHRREYEGATPKQRFAVVLDRINNRAIYESELVTHVSAVEAHARALVANDGAKSNDDTRRNYKKYTKREATGLVTHYLKLRGTTPQAELGEELWELFRAAEKARSLLVHECTYIDVQACDIGRNA